MTLNFTEGFATYGATSDFTKYFKWVGAGGGVYVAGGGRTGTGCVQFTNSNSPLYNQMWLATGKNNLTVYTAFWVRISSAPAAATSPLMTGVALGNQFGGGLAVASTGVTCAENGQSGSNQGSGTTNVCDNQWHWIETSNAIPTAGGTSATFQWYVDKVSQGTVSGGNLYAFNVLGGGQWYGVGMWGMSGAGIVTTFSDVIVWDSAATFPSSGAYPMGQQEVFTQWPTADSAVAFTPNTGSSNYTQVNEHIPDDDASYVQATSGSGLQDLYSYGGLPFTPAAINGVMLNSRMKNTGVGQCNWQAIGKSGATQRNGASTITPSMNYFSSMQEFGVDPNTSAAWTPSNLNASTMGLKSI